MGTRFLACAIKSRGDAHFVSSVSRIRRGVHRGLAAPPDPPVAVGAVIGRCADSGHRAHALHPAAQFAASTTAEMALNAVNIPVLREGNVLVLPNATLQVAEACSGIRSLMALMTIGLVIARFAESRGLARIAIVLAAVPVAVLVNALRVAVTSAATYAFGPIALVGVVHEALGGVMLMLALLLIAASARGIAQCRRAFTPEPVV
jgi:exosortase/archaeosortase family protein